MKEETKKNLMPSDEFLNRLIGKKIKVFYFPTGEPDPAFVDENGDPLWFEGKLIGFDGDIIAMESESDFKKIVRIGIETVYEKKIKG